MKVENFDKIMQKTILGLQEEGIKPTLLLHSCCAPCSTACIERIKEFFDLTVFYYNPNLDNEKEFELRANEQVRLSEKLNLKCLVEPYVHKEFLDIANGLESALEGGARCVKCFELRLKKTAEKAKEKGFKYFTTTLTVSPLKNANLINAIGSKIEKETGVKFLPTDFKKRNGYFRSVELSKEHELYRQNYCGCEFSKNSVPN